MSFEVLHGDCIEVMASLPTDSVDAIVTSPPYAEQRKSTYGGIPEKDYPAWTVAWMTQAWRVLKPDGSVIINIRPHIKNGVVSDYVLRTRLALRDAGWAELEELIWDKVSGPPMGNTSRPRRTWESLLWFGKHGRAYSDPKAGGSISESVGFKGSSGRQVRHGWDHGRKPTDEWVKKQGIARVPDIARVSLGHQRGPDRLLAEHPAPFPWQLAEWCGKLVCPPGGTILDPFSGSASTGVAAIRNGWDYIGIDAVAEYVDMSRKRLEQEAA